MKNKESIITSTSSKGAAIFKKMIEDKKTISKHFQNGGKIDDIKSKFNFVKTSLISGKS